MICPMRLLAAYLNHLSWKAINSEDMSLWETQPYMDSQHHVQLNREGKETWSIHGMVKHSIIESQNLFSQPLIHETS